MPRLSDVDLTLLESLDLLLEEAHVTRAARRLGVTQSAMSHRLRQLRRLFGDPLLASGPKGLVLTPRAQALRGPLRLALQDLGAVLRAAEDFDPATSSRRFALAMTDYAMAASFPRFLDPVRRAAPGVRFVLEPVTPDASDRLAQGRLDLVFTAREVAAAGVRRRRVFREGFVTIARSDHPVLGADGPLDLDTFTDRLDHLLVAPGGQPGGIVDQALDVLGRRRRVAIRIESFVPAPFLVAGTDLIATVPVGMALATAARLGLAVRAPPVSLPEVSAYLYWHARAEADPAHRWLREEVIEGAARSRLALDEARARLGW